jgi:hypothetical protein
MLRIALACALALAALGVPYAGAHPVPPSMRGYVSTVAFVEPVVLGLQATVLGGDDRLSVRNWSTKIVVILGYDGEPYLRFGRDGVFVNVHSPATYLNRVRNRPVKLPSLADPRARPAWERVSSGTGYVFHDRRIRWTGKRPPSVVTNDPAGSHHIRDWRIPGRADSVPFAIKGFLGYAPPAARTADGGGSPTVIVAVALTAVLLLGLALIPLARRRARSTA